MNEILIISFLPILLSRTINGISLKVIENVQAKPFNKTLGIMNTAIKVDNTALGMCLNVCLYLFNMIDVFI